MLKKNNSYVECIVQRVEMLLLVKSIMLMRNTKKNCPSIEEAWGTIFVIKICGYAYVLNFYVETNVLTDIGSKEL